MDNVDIVHSDFMPFVYYCPVGFMLYMRSGKKHNDCMQEISLKKGFALSILFIFLISIGPTVLAQNLNYEQYISVKQNKLVLSGSTVGEQFGAAISSGDYNADGYMDLLVGSPFASEGDRQWNGAVSLFFGSEEGFPSEPQLRFIGEFSGDQLGTTLVSGDFNNDGISDIAIGAYNAQENEKRRGKVYIIYGKLTWTSQFMDFALQKPDKVLTGSSQGDHFGLALSSIDINDDNVEDLLIGAPGVSLGGFTDCGVVYAYLGGNNSFENHNFLIQGNSDNEKFGSAISGGNFLGNPRNDLAIGAYKANGSELQQSGRVYLYENSNSYKFTNSPKLIIEGTVEKAWFGFSLDAADIDMDGNTDLVISSFPYLDSTINGKLSLIYGGTDLAAKGKKIFDSTDIVTNIEIEKNGQALLGASVMVRDINADGLVDIVAGAPGIGHIRSDKAGDLNVFYGSASGAYEERSVIHGEKADDWFAYSLASLDYNGDNISDMAIGSRYSDTSIGNNTGKVFLIPGQKTLIGSENPVTKNVRGVARGDFVNLLVEEFNLKNNRKLDLENCYAYKEFCFFNFSAKSNYDGIKFDSKMLLYPDIPVGSHYYDNVNVVTALGLMNGFMNENDSPFRPQRSISRIQALKVILSAAELIEEKHRFQLNTPLSQNAYFLDVDGDIDHMWWYERYTDFAVQNGIIDKTDYFYPDRSITSHELSEMISRTLQFLNRKDAEVQS